MEVETIDVVVRNAESAVRLSRKRKQGLMTLIEYCIGMRSGSLPPGERVGGCSLGCFTRGGNPGGRRET